MTPEEDALARVVQALEGLAIPYMVTGSVAASFHGRPRATHDADVVIDPTADSLERLISRLLADNFYVDRDGALEALRYRRAFNAIESANACEIDLIVRRDRPYSYEEMKRRQRVDLSFAEQVAIVTPEDAVLSKLEWARRSGDSERQLRDAAGVVELNPQLDREYVDRWASELGVRDLWLRLA